MRRFIRSGLFSLFGLLAVLAAPARAQLNVTSVLPSALYGEMFVDSVANRLYLTNNETVTALDGNTHQTLFTYPIEGIGISGFNPVTKQFYASSESEFLVLDAETGARVASMPFPHHDANHVGKAPNGVKVNSTGTRIYYSGWECTDGDKQCDFMLHVLDARTYERLNSVPLGAPFYLEADPALDRVYLSGLQPKILTVMDTDLREVIASLPLERDPRSMGLDAARHRLYLVYPQSLDYKVAVFDSADAKLLATVGITDNADFRVDPVTGNLFFVGLTYDPETTFYINHRTVFRWDGVSVNESGNAILSNLVQTPERLSLSGFNPATGRFYVSGNRSGKILVVEDHPPVDTAAPVVTATFTRPPDIGGWYKGNARVTLSADDRADGLGVYYFRLPSSSFDHPIREVFSGETTLNLAPNDSGSGHITLRYSVEDYAGNQTEGSVSADIDMDAPTTKAFQKPAPDGKTLLTLAAKDSGSGVTATFYQLDDGVVTPYSGPLTLDPDQARKVTFYSKDLVGYEESKQTVPVVRSGDVDGDGQVNIGDVVLLLRFVVTHDPFTNPNDDPNRMMAAADLNGSGTLEVTDAVLLLQALVGL